MERTAVEHKNKKLKYFIILLCLSSDDLIYQGEITATQWVKKQNLVGKNIKHNGRFQL